jgi:hypothetical protein
MAVLSSDDNLFLDVLKEPFCIENSDLGADGVTIPLVLIAVAVGVAVCFWIVEMRFPVANASAGDHLSAALA